MPANAPSRILHPAAARYLKVVCAATGCLLVALAAKGRSMTSGGTPETAAAAGSNAVVWRQEATAADDLKLLPGFHAELLYSVPGEEQGSWVALTQDDRGRLIASDQYGKLYRVEVPPVGEDGPTTVEAISVDIGMAQGLLYAFDSLYVVVNGQGPEGPGLYRVRDTDADDQFDNVELLRSLPGGGEHGPHAVILSPDGNSLYICAGNHTDLPRPPPEVSRVPQNWDEDQLLPRMWDARGHARGKLAPGGYICRTDPDGETWELVSVGYRNEYDIAFNGDGELFTYDADMEWDVGTPWYRPTRVNHVTSGSEFGWRSGTGKWPEWSEDSLPAVVDIGPGSPTGIVFGTGARFPAEYQKALYLCDWSYGFIYAVHLQPDGASYQGRVEQFVAGSPLPVTDILVGNQDGAMYFTIGGRRTQSGLYRVTYTGEGVDEDVSVELVDPGHAQGEAARQLRRRLEELHLQEGPEVVDQAWRYLGHPDRFIRYAARIAIEHQPVALWKERAFEAREPATRITALLALARIGEPSDRADLVASLSELSWSTLGETRRLVLLRAYQVAFARLGNPTADERSQVLAQINAHYPADRVTLNRELAQLLIYLEAPNVVERTLTLLQRAPTQEEQLYYVLCLRNLEEGWTPDQRRRYFAWFQRAAAHRGGASFGGFLQNIKNEALAHVSAEEQANLADVLAPPQSVDPADPIRPFVRDWTVAELLPDLEAGSGVRDYARGREMFAAALCFKCHRFAGEGGSNGPDLTGAGGRFSNRDLIEAIIEPDKVISDQYQSTIFELTNGQVVIGRVVNLNGNTLLVSENMLDPGSLTSVNRDQIEEMRPSATSLMPRGLLNTLTREEILDLMAYLRSGGNPDHEVFQE